MDNFDSVTIKTKHSLAHTLLKKVLLAAIIVGTVLSSIQLIFDAHQFNKQLDNQTKKMLSIVTPSITEAAYHSDTKMGEEALSRLQKIHEVRFAVIHLLDGSTLASIEKPLYQTPLRLLSDAIFLPTREYHWPLLINPSSTERYGILSVAIDTAYDGKAFIQRSMLMVLLGIMRAVIMALLLYCIYRALLTTPLNTLITSLTHINLEEPGKKKLIAPQEHACNELGLWVKTANQLLSSMAHNLDLRQKAERQIMTLSHYDYLTRLPNRKSLQKHLAEVLDTASHQQDQVAILCLGLDDFKSLNAQFSFNLAEHTLISLSDRIREKVSETIYIGRLGEDQFTLIMSQIEQPYEAASLAEAVLQMLREPIEINGQQITVSATIGISLFPDDGNSVDRLLQQAEFAMIMAKSRSHNRYQFYIAAVDKETRQLKKLEMNLHNALQNNEFHLLYQPQIDYASGQITGAEALLRWQHPEHGLVSPDTFIPMAESNLDIIPIGNWVLETACLQLKSWHQAGFTDIKMAVNLSALQLRDKSLSKKIDSLLRQHQLPAKALELEITETFIMENTTVATEHLNNIKAIGVTLALDDFGTGYSSLSYLKQFPFDKLKIDKSFIEGVPSNTDNTVIVEAIIQIGSKFNLTVLAEGIEEKEQEIFLISQGCQEGQGYYYGKPMISDNFIELLRSQ
ncbi:MAG: EAL domain-containing protein [Endozoicomonas sp. (ex Botrylloides leachii)]|nr:EAL domain-containing protein [Endozoicomonas sp. (ex Botrylloides leachii)]